MVLAFIMIAFMVSMMILSSSLKIILSYLPYVTGILGFLMIKYAFGIESAAVSDRTITIAGIIITEIIMIALTRVEETSGPVIAFSSMLFIAAVMQVVLCFTKINTWRQAVFASVVFIIIAVFVLASNHAYNGVIRIRRRNVFMRIIAAILYSASIGVGLFVIEELWLQYLKYNCAVAIYERIERAFIIGIILSMVIVAILKYAHDSLEPDGSFEVERQLKDA